MLMPYKDSLDKSMNEVIGFSIHGLFKKQPESPLGNFMADAIKTMAEKKFNKKIDAAFVNFGGIRSYIPKGDITIGKIFELMPFDNLIVLQELKGVKLKSFLDRVCEKGGWPVSKGITYAIKDKAAIDILINGNAIDNNATYIIANSDYIANGGDNCDMLKNIPKQNINYLMRDALIEYTKMLTQESKPIDVKIENRVVYGK
jgi:2',3'-cyclic-nucleotide 2'-phosphodiesterase (5'-nucleotidase family)